MNVSDFAPCRLQGKLANACSCSTGFADVVGDNAREGDSPAPRPLVVHHPRNGLHDDGKSLPVLQQQQ
jgi:hypothetical protein